MSYVKIPNDQFRTFHVCSESIQFAIIHRKFRWNPNCSDIFNDVIRLKPNSGRTLLFACKMYVCMHSVWSDTDDWFAMHNIFRFLPSISQFHAFNSAHAHTTEPFIRTSIRCDFCECMEPRCNCVGGSSHAELIHNNNNNIRSHRINSPFQPTL